jgi:hypothetical protein
MSCSSSNGSNGCSAQSVPDLNDVKNPGVALAHNPYCTARTINEPRDSYNQGIFQYRTMQDAYVHHSAMKQFDTKSGFQGCLGCNDDKPVCPTKSGISYPSHVNTETKLRGL